LANQPSNTALLDYFDSGARELAVDAGWESVAFVSVHPPILAIPAISLTNVFGCYFTV
jgi:hypothetical protein